MLCIKIVFLFSFWHSKQYLYTTCSELVFVGNSMNNLLSYCGLTNARMRASKKFYLQSKFILCSWKEKIEGAYSLKVHSCKSTVCWDDSLTNWNDSFTSLLYSSSFFYRLRLFWLKNIVWPGQTGPSRAGPGWPRPGWARLGLGAVDRS